MSAREASALEAALGWAPARLLESAHDAEGPLYFLTLMLMLYPHAKYVHRTLSHYYFEIKFYTGNCIFFYVFKHFCVVSFSICYIDTTKQCLA